MNLRELAQLLYQSWAEKEPQPTAWNELTEPERWRWWKVAETAACAAESTGVMFANTIFDRSLEE